MRIIKLTGKTLYNCDCMTVLTFVEKSCFISQDGEGRLSSGTQDTSHQEDHRKHHLHLDCISSRHCFHYKYRFTPHTPKPNLILASY